MRCAVYVVCSSRFSRESLAALFRRDRRFRLVGAGCYGPESCTAVGQLRPELVLLNPEGSDPEFRMLRRLHRFHPGSSLLLVGMSDDVATFLRAVQAGVVGYVLKDASSQQIVAAACSVLHKRVAFPPHLEWELFERISRGAFFNLRPAVGAVVWTRREKEIVTLLAQGLTNKEIAGQLHLSLQTVKNHVHQILRKSGVRSRFALAQYLPVAERPTQTREQAVIESFASA
jgi:two-component system nitrate/nitrite response regulator NarL